MNKFYGSVLIMLGIISLIMLFLDVAFILILMGIAVFLEKKPLFNN